MTYPVRYMALSTVGDGTVFDGEVLDTLDDTLPLCRCFFLTDAINIARALNVAEGYVVE